MTWLPGPVGWTARRRGQDPAKPWNGISIGLGFGAMRVEFGGLGVTEQATNPCVQRVGDDGLRGALTRSGLSAVAS